MPDGKVPQMFRNYPNLYADLSAGSAHTALSRDLEFTKDFLIEFQDRILYGRDYFDNRMQELLNSMDLPEEILQRFTPVMRCVLCPMRKRLRHKSLFQPIRNTVLPR